MAKMHRSWSAPLSEVCNNPKRTKELLDFLTLELNKQLTQALTKTFTNLHSNGYYRLEYETKIGRPNQQWNIPGNKAKYQRMIVERTRNTLSSLKERQTITKTCASFNYDITRKTEIRQALTQANLYPTDGTIRNICAAKKDPQLHDQIPAYLDYTTGDKQIHRREWRSANEFTDSIEVLGEWVELHIKVPQHIHSWIKIAKPVLIPTPTGTTVQYAYEVEPQPITTKPGELRLGVDLGKIHPFVASITSEDGSWSGALMPSQETEKLRGTIDRTLADQKAKYARRKRLEGFLEHREDATLRASWEAVNEDIQLQRSILSRRRAHLARLVAS